MNIHIPSEIIVQTNLTEQDIKLHLAMMLYEKNILSFGQARRLSGLNIFDFQESLGKNKIPIHYDSEDFAKDLENLKNI